MGQRTARRLPWSSRLAIGAKSAGRGVAEPMSTPAPEFSRLVRIDSLGAGPRLLSIEADDGERAALAARFELQAIGQLSAELSLTREGETVSASGTLRAAVTQSCVATGEPVDATVEEAFKILFRPE